MNDDSSASENAKRGGFASESALREHTGDIVPMFQRANLDNAIECPCGRETNRFRRTGVCFGRAIQHAINFHA